MHPSVQAVVQALGPVRTHVAGGILGKAWKTEARSGQRPVILGRTVWSWAVHTASPCASVYSLWGKGAGWMGLKCSFHTSERERRGQKVSLGRIWLNPVGWDSWVHHSNLSFASFWLFLNFIIWYLWLWETDLWSGRISQILFSFSSLRIAVGLCGTALSGEGSSRWSVYPSPSFTFQAHSSLPL